MKDLNTAEEVTQELQKLLPELQTRFAVKRIIVHGLYARPRIANQPLGSAIELLVETTRPLGLEFALMRDWLGQQLQRTVNVRNSAMLVPNQLAHAEATGVEMLLS